MPAGDPRHKGTGFTPVLQALRSLPEPRGLLPKDLWHYLDGAILATGWYPERHHTQLIEALARSPEVTRLAERSGAASVWQYFGRVAAQRDLAGDQDSLPPSTRTGGRGVYRGLLKPASDPEQVFARVRKLWSLYHDTGEIVVERVRDDDQTVVLSFRGYRFGGAGVEELQLAYVEQFLRLSGLAVVGSIRSSTARGDRRSEWALRLDPSPALTRFLAALPEASPLIRQQGSDRGRKDSTPLHIPWGELPPDG
ncbi:MAG: hypothetical protein FJ104_13260 [Deltaproteobacteria bacterium]|nr:hypothetical protein [Deltaproteobacteria bacterium]